MKKYLILIYLIALTINSYSQKVASKKDIKFAESQTSYMLEQVGKSEMFPEHVAPRTVEHGKFKLVKSQDWTSGFFAGNLWYLYELTGDKKWQAQADKFTLMLAKEQYNKRTHDLGFMIYCSYGNGFRLTQNQEYQKVIINAAKSLSTRFNSNTGLIQSWDSKRWKFPVIIDNMMNLELLFDATKFTGDSSFYKIAVSHANHTIKNHFRSDNSTFHVVDYDPQTGAVLSKVTHQGYADESAWARGQAWALYGYTMSYRCTKDIAYLNQAKKIAAYILNHPQMPKDKVPYWDFNDPKIPDVSKDASAAAIISSALYELALYTKDKSYQQNADFILNSLSKNYTSPAKGNFGFILAHSTGHRPQNSEVDVPLIYADYYYLEAMLRSKGKFNF